MGNLFERIHAAIKLSRGKCQECGAVLRNDNTSGTCSDVWAEAHWLHIHA
jgi:hypothetical protein